MLLKRSLKVKRDIARVIENKELQLAKLKEHSDKSTVCFELYNKLLIEKAILKQEYVDSKKKSLFSNIRELLPKKEKRICDYFAK